MKIYFKGPGGWEFSVDRQPMPDNRFYITAALIALGMLLVTVLLYEVWR